MDSRLKIFFLLIIILGSCKTQKKISKSTLQESQETTSIENHQQNTQEIERSHTLQIIRKDDDRSTIVSFDSLGSIFIDPSGAIRADGLNPRIEHRDRGKSTAVTQGAKESEINTSNINQSAEKNNKESSQENFEKEVIRTNYTPVILAAAGCLILIIASWFIYRNLTF